MKNVIIKFEQKLMQHFTLGMAGFFFFLMIGEIFRKDYHQAVNFMCFAFCNAMGWFQTGQVKFFVDYGNMQAKCTIASIECITELAIRLTPFIGEAEVVKILNKYGIELKNLWDDFDNKHRRRRKKFDLKELPAWISEIKDKISQELQPLGSKATRSTDCASRNL